MFGTTEILVIAGVIVLLFGASAIPKFARNIGRAKKEFEKGVKEGQSDEPTAEAEAGDDEAKPREREL